MDFLNSAVRTLVESYVGLFGDAHPLVSLVPLSIVVGVVMLWVFGKTSNQAAIKRQKKKVQAYLLELRLFGDDPGLLWKAQKDLVVGNLKYIGLMFKPAIYLTIPMVILLFHLDAVYGIAPIPEGGSAIVTVQAAGRLANTTPVPELTAPAGVEIETPGVRALDVGQFSWRIRAAGPAEGALRFSWNGKQWEKSVSAGAGPRYVSHHRGSSALESIASPGEPLLHVDQIESISINYPGTEIETGDFRLHWLIWFLVVSIVAAYALKGFFGITV